MRLLRFAIAASVAATAATPAIAQDARAAADLVARMDDPAMQEGLARAVQAMAGVLLDTRVGPLARLTDPADDIRPSDTLRDLQRRDDPDFERRLYAGTRRSAAAAGSMARELAAMLPELERTADRLRGTLGAFALSDSGGIDDQIEAPEDY